MLVSIFTNIPTVNKHYSEFLNRPHKHSIILVAISILPAFSKILEKVIATKLIK